MPPSKKKRAQSLLRTSRHYIRTTIKIRRGGAKSLGTWESTFAGKQKMNIPTANWERKFLPVGGGKLVTRGNYGEDQTRTRENRAWKSSDRPGYRSRTRSTVATRTSTLSRRTSHICPKIRSQTISSLGSKQPSGKGGQVLGKHI